MKEYRIKKPRCWVLRWYAFPTHRSQFLSGDEADYLGGGVPNEAEWVDASEAAEFGSVREADMFRRARSARRADGGHYWRIVRRGRVSK